MHRWDPIAPPVAGLVLPVPVGPDGPTPKQARGPGWRRSSHGLYVPSTTSDDLVEQRIVEASARGGVVTAWAALRMHGAAFFDGLARDGRTRLPVPLAANGAYIRAAPGVVVTGDRVPPDEVEVVHGIRCTTVERALYDEMQRIGDVHEMAIAAGAAYAGQLTSRRRMRLYAATRRWYRDVRTVKEAIEMSIEGCRSPQEDRFRMFWEYTARWGRPLVNRDILDEHGRWVATPDLIDVERGVVGEYAGADHRSLEQHESDIDREARLRGAGLEYVEAVGPDLRDELRLRRRMDEAEARARNLTRRWQVGPRREPTLDEVLERRDSRNGP